MTKPPQFSESTSAPLTECLKHELAKTNSHSAHYDGIYTKHLQAWTLPEQRTPPSQPLHEPTTFRLATGPRTLPASPRIPPTQDHNMAGIEHLEVHSRASLSIITHHVPDRAWEENKRANSNTE